MRKNFLFFIAAVTCIALLSCNSNEPAEVNTARAPEPALDKQWAGSFLDSMNSKFSQQVSAGDSVALASLYWPDAELLLDNSDVVKGKDIVHAWGAAIRMGLKEMTFSTTGITGSPAFIIETGNYEMKDGKRSILDQGKYVVVWEKRNGEWKLYRDIGCTSLPPAK